jgi:hypothetical protein
LEDGTEKVVILNKHRFWWLVSNCEAADDKDWKDQLKLAAQRDAVGRELKVYSDKKGKFFYGTIVDWNEQTGKHKIKFQTKSLFTKELNLENKTVNWRYTDLIGYRNNTGN